MKKEEQIDDKLAFEIRCALAKDHLNIDPDEAFQQFKAKQAGDASPGNKRTLIFTLSAIAAACIGILLYFTPFINIEKQQNYNGQEIYHAQEITSEQIKITIDGQEISLDEQGRKDINVKVNDDNVIDFSSPSLLDDAEIVQSTVISVPQGRLATIMLPDGSKVWLSPGSRIVFPLAFPSNAAREVKLTGEAYFSVTHDVAHPFIVNCNDFKTKVLGTEFNVRNYSGEMPVVTLVEGSVSVSQGTENLTLKPEQAVEVARNARLVAKAADVDVATSWKNGEFYFDGQTLRQIALEIGRWYNMDVVVVSDIHVNDSLHFNGDRSWSPRETIDHLQAISKAKLEIRENTLLLK